MKNIIYNIRPIVLTLLLVASFVTTTQAQEVQIPDPGLNAAIRAALQKPSGPLTQLDMLSLTVLSARSRNIGNLQGLEFAHNLTDLDLESNHLTNLAFPGGLTKLQFLDLSSNPLTNLTLSTDMTNLVSLELSSDQLTSLTVPAELRKLSGIDVENNRLTSLNLPSTLNRLDFLIAIGNQLTNLTLPAGLTAMTDLEVFANGLTSFRVPADMTNLIVLSLSFNQLTNLTLPPSLKNLGVLDLQENRLTSLNLSSSFTRLGTLNLIANQFSSFSLPAGLTNLITLRFDENQLTNLTLPAGLSKLDTLHVEGNRLTSLTLPPGLTNLNGLFLQANQLTNLTLPSDLNHLAQLDLSGNNLASLTLPGGLTNLSVLVLVGNQLTIVTLPPDMTKLSTLILTGNPLTTLVLSEALAITRLVGLVTSLPNQGVSVFTYPLAPVLLKPNRTLEGNAFEFFIAGPPGIYAVLSSTNLAAWSVLGTAIDEFGSILFTDVDVNFSPQKFYQALRQSPPTNMVFISPNTFRMGSPTNEQDRSINEGPQTTVILSRGFWIGKFEVTQAEYLSVMNTNPSPFPGDLSRPVSSVSWLDASNYCAKLTQRELAVGRIPVGTQYRLPTEAEWECAARAGTSTRFSYGDDPTYTELRNHSWYAVNSGLTPHPVGQKLPNPWGLYDMEGNVVEWCQDWFASLPGGVQTDPTGPASSASGRKVVRGGAFDNSEQSCRSASRLLFSAIPPLTDTDLGFRVVLVTAP
jgi:formylglycine-generating enzyme required for sulfatase activity